MSSITNRLKRFVRYRFLRRLRMAVGRGPWVLHIDAVLHDMKEAAPAVMGSWVEHELDGKLKRYGGDVDPDDPLARLERRQRIRESRKKYVG